MGYGIFLVYLVLSYIRIPEMYPVLTKYHFMMALGAMGTAFAANGLIRNSAIMFQPQTFLVIALTAAVSMSQVMTGFLGGGIQAAENFSITVATYFMIVANIDSVQRLRRVIGLTVVLSMALVLLGWLGVHYGFMGETFVMKEAIEVNDEPTGEFLSRMRALGSLNDPNDLSQVLILGVVGLGAFWAKGRGARNLVLLGLPAAWLVYGVYLTKSRGALLGLIVAVVMLLQRKVGRLGSVLVAAGLFFALLAANFTGGREVSANEDSARARIHFWSEGLNMLKSRPLVGVGYRNYPDENDGRAAHNSFIQCAAELGLIGYLVWIAIIVATITGLTAVQKLPSRSGKDGEDLLQQCARTVRVSLYVFLVTGWFLSRAYTETLFMLIAFGVVVIGIARKQGLFKEYPLRIGPLMGKAVAVSVCTLVLVKVMVVANG